MEERIKYEAEYILYSKNKTLEEISDELNISKRTLQNHINTLCRKIHVMRTSISSRKFRQKIP